MSIDILAEIHNKLPSLSKGQKRIATYILESYDKAAFQTAGALGRTVQVSESTVVRFAALLGYEGYPEMQKALHEVVRNRLTSVQRMEAGAEHKTQRDLLTGILNDDMERIRRTAEEIDRAAFDGAVDALLGARRIYVLGVRSSAALASFLSYYFQYLFEDIRLVTSASASEVFEQIVRISPQDVLLGISFPRYSSAAVRAMEYCRDAGAHTIALTDSASSPMAEHAEFLLCAKSDMVSVADSMVAPLSVLNALIAAVASRRKQETTETFNKLEQIWDVYHVYRKADE